jgi:hypothetical protein
MRGTRAASLLAEPPRNYDVRCLGRGPYIPNREVRSTRLVWPESDGHISTALVAFVSLIFISWNQLDGWLRVVDSLRQVA